MSPLTARVSEISVGTLVMLDVPVTPDALVVIKEVEAVAGLIVPVVFELVKPDAHAASALSIAQNLITRRKVNS